MNYKIITKFIKDISFEIPNVETLLFLENNLEKYNVKVDITSKPIKQKIVQVDTILKFENDTGIEKKAQIEITLSAVVKVETDLKNKKELQEIILIHVPTDVYPMLFEIFALLIEKSGLPKMRIEKNIDFRKLYNEKFS